MNKQLVEKTNVYLSDLAVMYIKLHNLHWNVVGPQFKAIHEYLEVLYNGFAEKLDAVAELLKMNDEYPLASMGDYLLNAKVHELQSITYDVKETLHILLKDFSDLNEEAMEVRSLAQAEDNFSLSNMMEDHIALYKKNIWFIESMLK